MGEDPPEGGRVEPLASRRDEHRVLGAAHELPTGLLQVTREQMAGLLSEGNDSLLAALPAYVQLFTLEVDVGEIEAHRLGAAQAGGVDELYQRSVAQGERTVSVQRVQRCFHLARLRRVR